VSDELSRIEKKVEGLADAEIATTCQPYLLSKLGKDLGADLKIIKQEAKSLADFIKSRFPDKYEIIITGDYKNIQSIILKNARDVAYKATEEKEEEKKTERFNYRFWAAFSVPLEGDSRFLNIENFTFEDTQSSPSSSHELIEPEYIAPTDIKERDKAIAQNIHRWIEQRGFKTEQFLARPHFGRSASASGGQARTLLHAVIETLDKKQLSSVSLPLDVVATLLNKSV